MRKILSLAALAFALAADPAAAQHRVDLPPVAAEAPQMVDVCVTVVDVGTWPHSGVPDATVIFDATQHERRTRAHGSCWFVGAGGQGYYPENAPLTLTVLAAGYLPVQVRLRTPAPCERGCSPLAGPTTVGFTVGLSKPGQPPAQDTTPAPKRKPKLPPGGNVWTDGKTRDQLPDPDDVAGDVEFVTLRSAETLPCIDGAIVPGSVGVAIVNGKPTFETEHTEERALSTGSTVTVSSSVSARLKTALGTSGAQASATVSGNVSYTHTAKYTGKFPPPGADYGAGKCGTLRLRQQLVRITMEHYRVHTDTLTKIRRWVYLGETSEEVVTGICVSPEHDTPEGAKPGLKDC